MTRRPLRLEATLFMLCIAAFAALVAVQCGWGRPKPASILEMVRQASRPEMPNGNAHDERVVDPHQLDVYATGSYQGPYDFSARRSEAQSK